MDSALNDEALSLSRRPRSLNIGGAKTGAAVQPSQREQRSSHFPPPLPSARQLYPPSWFQIGFHSSKYRNFFNVLD